MAAPERTGVPGAPPVLLPTPRPAGDEDRFHAAWRAALDELELDVAEAERLLDEAHRAAEAPAPVVGAWLPPLGLGPLPRPLLERATALVERQSAAARRMVEAIGRGRRHAAAAEAMRVGVPAGPVYVDSVD
ncbi:hypothetical protein [Cellulomonas endophytica]|uniref:hypothetical protein n=1 Tax=Cellulomonas endophytica TaxID=2494735 RepID=UPI001F0BE577|nr:hypothetical protein [Cellulomonas endophytica]